MSTTSLSIVIACGGTGGHLFPGISVAQTLKNKGHRVTLLISEKQVDSLAASKYGDLEFRKVPAIGMPRIYSPAVIPFLKKLWNTIKECRKILDDVHADVVLGMGGFTSFPPVYAASRKKISAFIHESNALPGKANRLTARWCRKVLLGVPDAAPYFSKGNTSVVGTPIRMELTDKISREEGAARMQLDPSKKTILVMGGSQGARNLNSLVVDAARECADLCQFLIITGTSDFDRIQSLAKGYPHITPIAFCSDMAAAYACSDAAISRSGASSLTELGYFGIPSFLIPYPFAAGDHQAYNARVYSMNGAAEVIRQEVLEPERIVKFVTQVLTSPEKWSEMNHAALETVTPDSAELIANELIRAVNS